MENLTTKDVLKIKKMRLSEIVAAVPEGHPKAERFQLHNLKQTLLLEKRRKVWRKKFTI